MNMAELAMDSEYVLIFMNMSNCARILDVPASTKTYLNVGKYISIFLTLYN